MTALFKKKRTERESVRQPRLMQGQDDISFRRSRTLTGSKSSEVRAANETKAELKSERLKKHELKRRRRAIASGLVVLLCFIATLYYLLSQYVADVRVVGFTPASVQITSSERQQYREIILQYLREHPGERFRFSLNNSKISEFVHSKYPELEKVQSEGGAFGHGDFTITVRQPIASWQIGEKLYFVDEKGEAFEKNYLQPPEVNVVDNSGASVTEGSAIASQSFLRFLGRLVALMNTSGLGKVVEASLPPNTTREIDIKLEGRGYSIKTHTDRDPATEVEDLQRVVRYLEARKITPQYIDLRVEGRAFYR